MVNSINNITKIVLLLVVFTLVHDKSFSQKYSVDKGKIKRSGNIGVKYRLYVYKENKKNRKELRVIRKEDKDIRKDQKRQIKNLQTKATQKRMKELYRSAVRVNKQKPAEYLHQRFYNKVSDDVKVAYIKSKLFFKSSYNNISQFVSISGKNEHQKKQKFFEELY